MAIGLFPPLGTAGCPERSAPLEESASKVWICPVLPDPDPAELAIKT
jgi:ferredoxin-thioredoxin reductase catalytic subunit